MGYKKFYDIHCHVLDLSHVNVTAFIRRKDLPGSLLFAPVLLSLFPNIAKKYFTNITNLLAVIDSDITDIFLLIDYFLKEKHPVVNKDNTFQIGDTQYNKIVLTPLMMDFGYKNIKSEKLFYNLPPRKPIQKQVTDSFNAIKKYMKYKLIKNGEKNKLDCISLEPDDKSEKLFEIYPFLGINTVNYDIDEVQELLNKYFGDFKKEKPAERQKKLQDKMGDFNGDLDDKNFDFNYMFAGVKVYPPLGFDPWPDAAKERDKVIKLFDFCSEKSIPVTTHCSEGGFKVDKYAKKNSNPKRWAGVLKHYKDKDLRINFAHFGNQSKCLFVFPKREWRKTLLGYAKEYKNVFIDFSCQANKESYYKKLEKLINTNISDNSELPERILFGSDFVINLIWSESYNQYLNYFKTARYIKGYKDKFCSLNPEKFLFG
jgi:hypothetical protein